MILVAKIVFIIYFYTLTNLNYKGNGSLPTNCTSCNGTVNPFYFSVNQTCLNFCPYGFFESAN